MRPSICGLAAVLTLAAPTPAHAFKLELLGGVSLISWGFDVNPVGDTVTFESDASPYFARNLEARFFGLWGFDGGLGYVTNQLLGLAGFSARDEIVGIDDPIASMLLGNLSRDLGPVRLDVTTVLRHFELQRTYRGHWLDANLPLTYLPFEGAPVTLGRDQKINLASEQFELALRAYFPASLLFGELPDPSSTTRADLYVGYHRLAYTAPLVAEVSDPSPEGTTFFQNVYGTSWSSHLLDIGLHYDSPAVPSEGEYGLRVRIPAELGFASAENQYFDAGGGVSIGLGVDAAVSYGFVFDTSVLMLELGFQAEWFSSLLTDEGATIKQDVPYYDLVGQPSSYPAVTSKVSISREETVWGPYLNFSWLMDFGA
ncbi:hypothetical protein L6R52_09720 [Myxococcota bacterium]|nr:hypothetical protein [Myxococcota bacterium]